MTPCHKSTAGSTSRRSSQVHYSFRGRFAAVRRGNYPFVPPFGYGKTDGRLLPIPEEADVVRSIFTLRSAGATCERIALELTSRGVRTARSGGPWRLAVIYYVLGNPIYKGLTVCSLRDGTEIAVETPHTRIVDPELWQAVQLRLQR